MADAGAQPAVPGLARALALVEELLAIVEQLRDGADDDGQDASAGLEADDLRDAFRAARMAPPRRVPGLFT